MANLNRYGKNAWKVNLLNWGVRLVILGVIAGGGFFGYTRLQPVISEKIEEWKSKGKSEEEEPEPEEENNGIGTAIPEERVLQPVYLWDFNTGMEEVISGTVCTPYGDSHIVEIENPGAPVSNALYLDGDEDYIDCGREIQFDHDFTLNALVNCQAIYKDYTAIIGKYETDNEGPLVLSFRQGHLNCWIISDSYHGDIDCNTELLENAWYDIAVVHEGGEIRIYINGMLDGQAEVGQLNNNQDTITIGRQAALYKPDQYQYQGYIGKIAIYDTAITEEEVINLAVQNLQPRVAEETAQIIMTVTASSLNVRGEPSTNGAVLIKLQSGEQVEVLDDPSQEWVYIRCIDRNNEEGYVASKYLAWP